MKNLILIIAAIIAFSSCRKAELPTYKSTDQFTVTAYGTGEFEATYQNADYILDGDHITITYSLTGAIAGEVYMIVCTIPDDIIIESTTANTFGYTEQAAGGNRKQCIVEIQYLEQERKVIIKPFDTKYFLESNLVIVKFNQITLPIN